MNNEKCCLFCENVNSIVDAVLDTETRDELFELLYNELSNAIERAYNTGYIESLRTNANLMLEIADDLEKGSCGCEECREN